MGIDDVCRGLTPEGQVQPHLVRMADVGFPVSYQMRFSGDSSADTTIRFSEDQGLLQYSYREGTWTFHLKFKKDTGVLSLFTNLMSDAELASFRQRVLRGTKVRVYVPPHNAVMMLDGIKGFQYVGSAAQLDETRPADT